MFTCKETARLVATDELAEASLLRRLSVWMHCLMCKDCRRYADQLRRLGQVARTLSKAQVDDNADSVQRLQAELTARVSQLGIRVENND